MEHTLSKTFPFLKLTMEWDLIDKYYDIFCNKRWITSYDLGRFSELLNRIWYIIIKTINYNDRF